MTSVAAALLSNADLRRISLANGTLTLTWDDIESTLDGVTLRAACRCAQCRFARHKLGIADNTPLPAADGDRVAIAGVSSMGYGLQLKFSDGHDRGIYPLSYLRELAAGSTQAHN